MWNSVSPWLQDIMPYLWNISIIEPGIARRLGLAIAAMMVSKGFGLAVPIMFKVAVGRGFHSFTFQLKLSHFGQ
jgi:hypothetical protein